MKTVRITTEKALSATEKAILAWGKNTLPHWIAVLAQRCDEESLRQVAKELDVSPAIVSLAINNKREKLHFLEKKVRADFFVATVNCPVLGTLPLNECLQEQVAPFTSAVPLRIQLYRACRGGCQHYKAKENKQGCK